MPLPRDAIPRPAILYFTSLDRKDPIPLDESVWGIPDTPLCRKAVEWVSTIIPTWTLNHAMRTYCWSMCIIRWAELDVGERAEALGFDREEIFLSAVLHEIGFDQLWVPNSRLSLEFWSGIKAREWLLAQQDLHLQSGGDKQTLIDWADEAFEAISMHSLSIILQNGRARLTPTVVGLGALHDLMGKAKCFIHRETIRNVCARYPRLGYAEGLRQVALTEIDKKPGCLFEASCPSFMSSMFDVECYDGLQGELKVDDEWLAKKARMAPI
jgi:cyanamide hydratase